MHKPENILENEKIHRDFELQTDHIIPTRRSDLMLIKKQRTCHPVKTHI